MRSGNPRSAQPHQRTRRSILPRRWLGLLLAVSLFAAGTGSLAASETAPSDAPPDPQAISLSYFRGNGQADGVILEWGTETEFDTAGFLIRRANTQSGTFNDPGIGFISAAGSELGGFDYTASDTTAIIGQSYWYKLVEVETNGAESEFGPINVFAGATPTPTTVVIAQPTSGGSTPIPTSTGLPTATPQPSPTVVTATPAPTRTDTPGPTDTPAPTGTATRTPISIQDNPTATPFVFPTATPDAGSPGAGAPGVVEAAQELTLEAYPGPTVSYPEPDQPTQAAPAAYPGAVDGASPTLAAFPTQSELDVNPAIGPGAGAGSSQDLAPLDSALQDDGPSPWQGRILLWVGFILALAVFGAGVYAAIVMANRRPSDRP